jgi:hypothetical protein
MIGQRVYIEELDQFGIVKEMTLRNGQPWIKSVAVKSLKNGIQVSRIIDVVSLTISIARLIKENWDVVEWVWDKVRSIFKRK